MVKLITLHVGAPKCGSSAIQKTLSQNPRLKARDGRRIAYAAITGKGTLLNDRQIQERAKRNASGYISSVSREKLEGLSDVEKQKIRKEFSKLDTDEVVLSCEGWLAAPSEIACLLGIDGDRQFRSIVYVRPQLDFLNAGWWQWGAWQNITLDDWIRKQIRFVNWSRTIGRFMEGFGHSHCTIRLLSNNILADLFDFLDVDAPEGATGIVTNRGLPGPLLRLFQRHRELLRPGPHASAIDFVLSQALEITGGSPWVIDRENMVAVLEAVREDNEALLAKLDPNSAELMRSDPRWWAVDAYEDKKIEPWSTIPADDIATDKLTAELAHKLFIALSERQSRES